MQFKWEDYNYEKHLIIDDWNNDSKYGDIINKYAMFNEPLSETSKWYSENKMGKIKDVIKVIEDGNDVVGFVVLNVSKNLQTNNLLIGINPIVVNPMCIGCGKGKKILKDLIDNYTDIVNVKGIEYNKVVFTAGADESNERCYKMLFDLGFIKTGVHDDGTFGYYEKIITK